MATSSPRNPAGAHEMIRVIGARENNLRGIDVEIHLAAWVRGVDDTSVGPLLQTLQQTLDSFVDIELGYLSLSLIHISEPTRPY